MSSKVWFEAAAAGDFAAVNRLARQVHELHVSWRPDIFRKTEFPISQEDFRDLVNRQEIYVLRGQEGPVAYGIISTLTRDRPGLVPRSILRLEELCSLVVCCAVFSPDSSRGTGCDCDGLICDWITCRA